MSQKIRFKRGNTPQLPILDVGEPALCTDTNNIFIGTNTGNLQIATANQQVITNLNSDMLDGKHATDFANISHNHDASSITSGTLDSARIPVIDASKITSGTIDIARLPQGALARLVIVADQSARFALTINDVQKGDTVKQIDTGVMYYVVDDTKLNEESGYSIYTAGSVDWNVILNKPITYPPSTHNHNHSDLTNIDTNQHIDHSTVSITSGTGLTGGGDITTSRTISLTGQSLALHNLSTNGLITRTNTNTITTRTITPASTRVSIVNGDGINGNPTIDVVESNLSLNNLSEILSIAKGGTGATSANSALNNLLPLQTGHSGEFLRSDGVNTYWSDYTTISNIFIAHKNGVSQNNIPINTYVKLTFPFTEINIGNKYNTSTSRYVPVNLGIYLLCANVHVNGGLSDRVSLEASIYKNGVLYRSNRVATSYNTTDDTPTICLVSFCIVDNSTDYFEVYFFSGGGNPKNINGAISATHFFGYKIE